MKKLLAVLLMAVMTTSLAACGNTNNGGETPSTGGADLAEKELVVATLDMNGDFVPTSAFGNNSYDLDIRYLIHGYDTVQFTRDGEFVLNETVVKNLETSEDADGNKTYTFTLNELKWNDGEPVTAKDYVFALLLSASDALVKAEGSDSAGEYFIGYDDYHTGATNAFKGVKLVDDSTFSVTIDKAELPYFWEFALAASQPYPMHVLAADGDITSDDNGATFTGDMTEAVNVFKNDYRTNPAVSCGPYKFVSFENGNVKLVANENFAGTYEGKKPQIKNIVVKTVNATIDMDTLVMGETDMVVGVVEGEKIEKAKANPDTIQESSYPRNGFGTVPFANDIAPTNEASVRRGIAYILDKDELIQNILGGYGTAVNSDYSTASWTYQAKKAELEEKLTNFAFSLEKANEELNQSSYKFEADGVTPWDASKAGEGYYRHNANGEQLAVRHLGTNDNPVTDTIELQLKQNAPKVGINYTVERTDFAGLLDNYYDGHLKPAEERYHMFNMALGHSDVDDPYYASYACEYAGTSSNPGSVCDEELDAIMKKMRTIESSETDAFADAWLEYEIRWNELLPLVPIYANQYYDFADADLEGFHTTPFWNWSRSICDLSWSK